VAILSSKASGKLCNFPDESGMSLSTQSIDDKILRSIRAKRSARAFTAKDFTRFGHRPAIWQALAQLVKTGQLRRIRQGLYDLPRPHPLVGQTAPDPMGVVRTLMADSDAIWQPSGAYAANLLGLSEQVPARIIILTNGVPKKVSLGKLTLDFRRTAPRNLLGAGRPAGMVIQAVRHLRGNLTPKAVDRLRHQLDLAAKEELRDLNPKLPEWMRPLIHQLAT
jgi:hypothetical protein